MTTYAAMRVETGPTGVISESVYDPGHDLSMNELIKFRDMNEDQGAEELDAFGQNVSSLS